MILKINYFSDECSGIVYYKGGRIKTKKDVERIERLIEKKTKRHNVKVTNWKIIGTIGEKIRPFNEED